MLLVSLKKEKKKKNKGKKSEIDRGNLRGGFGV